MDCRLRLFGVNRRLIARYFHPGREIREANSTVGEERCSTSVGTGYAMIRFRCRLSLMSVADGYSITRRPLRLGIAEFEFNREWE